MAFAQLVDNPNFSKDCKANEICIYWEAICHALKDFEDFPFWEELREPLIKLINAMTVEDLIESISPDSSIWPLIKQLDCIPLIIAKFQKSFDQVKLKQSDFNDRFGEYLFQLCYLIPFIPRGEFIQIALKFINPHQQPKSEIFEHCLCEFVLEYTKDFFSNIRKKNFPHELYFCLMINNTYLLFRAFKILVDQQFLLNLTKEATSALHSLIHFYLRSSLNKRDTQHILRWENTDRAALELLSSLADHQIPLTTTVNDNFEFLLNSVGEEFVFASCLGSRHFVSLLNCVSKIIQLENLEVGENLLLSYERYLNIIIQEQGLNSEDAANLIKSYGIIAKAEKKATARNSADLKISSLLDVLQFFTVEEMLNYPQFLEGINLLQDYKEIVDDKEEYPFRNVKSVLKEKIL